MRVVWCSDLHLGLKTDGIDRTDEILDIVEDIIDYAIDLEEKTKEKIVLVFGGDIFDNNHPDERLIGLLIYILNRILDTGFKTFFMAGNHDEVPDPDRVSCLGFIRHLGVAYPNIILVDDIKTVNMGTFDTGPLYFTFLPHVSNALIKRKVRDKEINKIVKTQDYINGKSEAILKAVGSSAQHIIFSHLNVKGAFHGSEENLLKKSTVYIPECLISPPVGFTTPDIVQAHIHSRCDIGNIHIVGNQYFCGFGERETDKYFLDLELTTSMGGGPHKFNYIKTNCLPFKQLEVNMVGDNTPFLERDDVLDFLEGIDRYTVVKFDVTTDVESSLTDWKGVVDTVYNKYDPHHIKPIIPRVIADRRVRSREQKIGIPVKDSIQVYLKRNIKNDKERLVRVYKRSLKYL